MVTASSEERPVSQADHPRGEAQRPALGPHLDPSHAWVLGLVVESDGTVAGPGLAAWAIGAECTCPEFCERDHANE